MIYDLNCQIHLGNTQPAKEAFLSADCKERVPRQAPQRISPLHMLLRLQNKELNYQEPRLDINAKKGEAARPPPSSAQAHGSVPSTGQRRPGLPRADPAVLSARWGLASGFGTGPGVPPMLWPLTGGRRPPLRCPGVSYTCPGGRMAHRGDDSGASSCPDRA